MNKHVIFIPHYKGSFKALLHIALHIKENNDVNPHFVLYFDDDSEAKRTLQDHGIGFSIYRNRLFTRIPLIGSAAKLVADLVYSVRLINRLSPVQAMVCAVETHELEYALISVLNRRNINTIVMQWAQTVPKEYYQSVDSKIRKITAFSKVKDRLKNIIKRIAEKIFGVKYAQSYGDGDAKYFAVMGSYYKEMFFKQGVSETKLVVTGHPEFDCLYDLSLNIKDQSFKQTILEKFGLDNAKPIWILAREAIVYFKLVPEEKDKQDISDVLEILSKYHPQVQIILKLHPRDSKEYYEFVREKFPHVIIIHECDLYSLIAVCDLYISQISNTMMWAIALDKPVISYDFNHQPHWDYFRDKEGVIKVETPADLAQKVGTIKNNGLSSKENKNCQIAKLKYMLLDGRACERITSLILEDN